MKVVGYARVSTVAQSDEGISLEAQEEKLRQYASLYDLELTAVHVDAGVSAKTLQRPGLQAALTDLTEGRAEALVVVKLDRLTRSVVDLGTLVADYFNTYDLLSVSDSIDTRSASGRLVLNVLVSVAQWEREAIAERTAEALSHLKSQGVILGGEALGWSRTTDLDVHGRRVIHDIPLERQTVNRIVELRQQGLSLREICKALETEGWKTKRGGKWSPKVVRSVLLRAA